MEPTVNSSGVVPPHVLPGRGQDGEDPPGDGREDVRDTQIVEGDPPRRVQRGRHLLLADHLDAHLLRLELLVGEPYLAGRGTPGLPVLGPRAGEQQDEEEEPPHVRPTAASSWNRASQRSCRSLRNSARACAQTRCAPRRSSGAPTPSSYCTG